MLEAQYSGVCIVFPDGNYNVIPNKSEWFNKWISENMVSGILAAGFSKAPIRD